jgi:dTDP-4-amino-4,6-dideoxygalactose transaminase
LSLRKSISFNKPFFSGNETKYIEEISKSGDLTTNGGYSTKCKAFFKSKYNFDNCFLTSSCTSALEMSAILCDIQPGDEVIIPSFTFPSTANAFILRGATIVFCDSSSENPNIDVDKVERLITKKTKLIVPIHYGGSCCDMEQLMEIANRKGIQVVEDAAQAINVFVKLKDGSKKALGSFGDFSTFSFHHTKNITCGAGGMLVVNDVTFLKKAFEISENGTNKNSFDKGEVKSYEWTSIGSSFQMSEINAAYLYAQLEALEINQNRRKQIWDAYSEKLSLFMIIPEQTEKFDKNHHIFYITCKSFDERTKLISYMSLKGIQTAFHYQSLHRSKYFQDKYEGESLINANNYSDLLLRLPMYSDLSNEEVNFVSNCILEFYAN